MLYRYPHLLHQEAGIHILGYPFSELVGKCQFVVLDIGYITEEMLGEDFYRWLYTAFTRATHRLYLVNLPEEFEEYVSS